MHTSLLLYSFVFCLLSNVNLCSLFITWRDIDRRATDRNWIISFECSADFSFSVNYILKKTCLLLLKYTLKLWQKKFSTGTLKNSLSNCFSFMFNNLLLTNYREWYMNWKCSLSAGRSNYTGGWMVRTAELAFSAYIVP